MAYFNILKDLGMNYTLNRPLLDGNATARIEVAKALAAKIVDFDTWHSAWLDLARRSETEGRWLDAATYYHQAEFYLPAGRFATVCTTTSPGRSLAAWRDRRTTNASKSHIKRAIFRFPFARRRRGVGYVCLQWRLQFVRRGILSVPEAADGNRLYRHRLRRTRTGRSDPPGAAFHPRVGTAGESVARLFPAQRGGLARRVLRRLSGPARRSV